MSTLLRLPSMLVAALVVVALAAPTAVARPVALPKAGHRGTSERAQVLRISSLPLTSKAEFGASGPVYRSYEPPASVPATPSAYADGGTPWMTIGVAIAAACFVVASAAALAARNQVHPEGSL